MNNEKTKKNEKASSNFKEIQPKGKVDKGNKSVTSTADKVMGANKPEKTKNPAKQREESEQPVHPIKQAPKE